MGAPPCCEMVLKTVSDDCTSNLTVAVTISGTVTEAELNICRVSEIPRKGN